MLTEKFAGAHALAIAVALERIARDVIKRGDSLTGGREEFSLVPGRDAVRRIVAHGYRAHFFGGDELLEGFDPAEGQGHDLNARVE